MGNTMPSMGIRIAGIGAVAALAVTGVAVAPAHAAIGIGVAPSPNGLVMVGVPTSIAATGFKGSAKVYRLDAKSGAWSLIGSVRQGAALPYTFPAFGKVKVKVVPTAGKAKTFVVPVYARHAANNAVTSIGGVVFPSSTVLTEKETAITMNASEGCVLVDVGLKLNPLYDSVPTGTIVVQSTAAPEVRLPVVREATQLGIPIRGDAVLTFKDLANTDPFRKATRSTVWYCLTPTGNVLAP